MTILDRRRVKLAQRALAGRHVSLRERIDATGDPDLLQLAEDNDMAQMTVCGWREISGEWAETVRELVPADALDGACKCATCTISRGLRWFEKQKEASGE